MADYLLTASLRAQLETVRSQRDNLREQLRGAREGDEHYQMLDVEGTRIAHDLAERLDLQLVDGQVDSGDPVDWIENMVLGKIRRLSFAVEAAAEVMTDEQVARAAERQRALEMGESDA